MNRARGLFVLLLLGVALFLVYRGVIGTDSPAERAYAAARADFVPDSVVVLGPIGAPLRESSGLAIASDGLHLWSHNDSGDEPRFYALDRSGTVVATFDVAGIEAQDWEAMDAGPCPATPAERCLYFADTGDNARRRDILTVYVVPEPAQPTAGGAVETVGRIRYLYPEGSRDAEALAISPRGDLVVITKGRAPEVMLFHLDPDSVRSLIARDDPVRFGEGRVLDIVPDWAVGRIVTGASFRPDGSTLAIRTPSEIYQYAWPALTPSAPPCFLGTREPQGEAIAWDGDEGFLLSSETNLNGQGMLSRVRCRGG